MREISLLRRHTFAVTVALCLIGLLNGLTPAFAADVKAIQAAILKTPMMKGLKLDKLVETGALFTSKLGAKKLPVVIFNTGTSAKPAWNIALYPKSLKLGSIYKTGGGTALAGIALTNPAIVLSDKASGTDFKKLPKPVQDGIKKVFGTSIKKVTYPAGVNFSFTLDVTKTIGLKDLKTALGVTSTKVPMAGTMGLDLVRYLANGKASTKNQDLAAVSLSSVLKGIRPKSASTSFTSPNMIVSFRGTKDGKVGIIGGATITTLVGKKKLAFKTGLRFDLKAKNADTRMISIYGPLVKPLKKVEDFGGHMAAVLNLNSAVMGNKRLAVAFSGTTDKKKPFKATAKIDKGKIVLEQAFPANLTVKDVLGYSQQALDKVPFKNPKKIGNVITGMVKLAGSDMEAYVFKADAKAKKPYLALIPKNFIFSSWVPAAKGSLLDGAKVDKAALLVVPSGGGGDRPLRELPKIVSDKIGGVVDKKTITNNKNKLPIADGLNLYTRVDVNKSNHMKFMFDKLQIKDRLLTFVGAVNPVVFWVLPEKTGAQLKKNKKIHKEILKTFKLATSITRPQIPGVVQFLEFGPGVFRFRGGAVADRIGVRTDTGDVEVVSEIINSVKVKLPGKDIGMRAQLNLHKGIADNSYKIKIIGTSTFDWKKAFDIPFMTLNDISLAATFNVNKTGGHAFAAGLQSNIQLGAQKVKSAINLVFQKSEAKKGKNKGKKVYKVEDLVLSVPGKIELSKLPGLSQIPGVKEFAFENYTVSKAATHGTLIWKTLGLKAQAAMVRINGKYSLFGRFPELSLKSLFRRLPKPLDLIGELKMPRAVLSFSSQKLTGYELRHLPLAAQAILKGIVKKTSDEVPIWNGVTLIGALGENDLPKPLHKIIADDLGVFKVIDGDLVLAGGLTGLFGGNPTIGLYADLPGFKFPANQPWSRIVSFERAKANFFIRGDVGATMFNLGVGGEMQIKVPHLVDPKKVDTLKFRGEGYVSADAVSAAGGVKVAARMEGKWREPFGLKNFTFENPAILIGADSEGSVEMGVGATAEFAARNRQKLRFAGDFITNINFSSTIPLPKKLGVRLQAKKLGIMAQMEVADAMFRGVLTGPMANVVTKLIPDPTARKAAQFLQTELRKRSMIDILQIEKLPYPYFEMRDVDVYFATPGAVIPGREDTLAGMGMVVAGKMSLNLMGQRFPIGEVNNRLTFADGLKIYGKLEPRNLGPLKLKKAVVDVAANIQALPYFKIKADAALFGATEKLDIEVSKDKIGFFYDKNLGPVIKMRIDAKTVGKDLFRVRDFTVKASTKTSIDTVMTKEVFPRMGMPKVVSDMIAKSTPLVIDGGAFEGSLTEFVTGKPVTLKLDHKFFGQRMDPAVVELRPAWKDPLSAFPAIPIADQLKKSFLIYLATNPVKLPAVNLGLIKVEDAKLSALATDPKDPKFLVRGKISNFLGASRAVDIALSDKAYAFRVKDKIAGGLWDADFRAWSVGGTAQAPHDIRFYGRVDSDFEKWLRQQVGKNLNKGFNAINAGYTSASNGLRAAESKVRSLDNLIGRKRDEARRDLNNLRHFISQARKHLDHTKWVMDKAWSSYRYYDRRWRDERRGAFWPWEWAKVAVLWGLRSGAWVAGKAAEGLYDAANSSFKAIDKGLTNIPLDLHPKVAPLIVARALALGTLQTARLAVEGAQHLNKEFKSVTNALVNAVAGAKVLVLKKATFQGSLRETKSNFFMLADVMKQENVTLKLKVNLLKPWETDLRALTVVLTSMIKGERVNLARESMPAPPALPVAIVSKKEIGEAIAAAARERIRIALEAKRKEEARKRQLAAATQPKPQRPASSLSANSNLWVIGKDRIGNDWGIHRWDGGGWTKMPGNSTKIAAGPDDTAVSVDVSGSTHFWDGGKWSSLPGSHSDATIGPDGTIYALGIRNNGGNYDIFRWDVNRWTQLPDRMIQVSAGPNGTLYGVSAAQYGYRWDGQKWHRLPGRMREISVAGDGTMWAIGIEKQGANFNIMKWDGRGWKTMSGSSAHITAGPNGTAVAIDTGGPAHYWTGAKWEHLSGSSRDVSMAKVGVPTKVYSGIYVGTNGNKQCLDSSASGGELGAIGCQDHRNLRWTFWTDGTIRHGPQGLCVTARNGNARAVVTRCDGSSDQKWAIRWSGGRGPSKLDPTWRFRVVHIASGRCLQEGGNRNTAAECRGSNNAGTWPAEQTWRAAKSLPRPASREANVFTQAQLVNASGQCADENSGKLTRGGKVIMWTCNGSGASRERQLWTHNGRGQITSTNGLCLDVENPNVRRGIPIIIWGCNGSGAPMQRQRWRMLADGRIQHIQSGLCLDATDNGRQRGRLVLSTCSTTSTQKWRRRGASG